LFFESFFVKIKHIMISVTELRVGRTFQIDGVPYQVVEYKHTKMGRGTASIRVKIRNLQNGSVVPKTFISGAKVEPVELETKLAQYLYRQGDEFYFADPRTFEQFSLPESAMGGKEKFLKEQEEVKIIFWEEKPLNLELPLSLVFEVAQTNPGIKGNSVNASFKPATLDNGLGVQVPLFIKIGDRIKVDTRTGSYIERVK